MTTNMPSDETAVPEALPEIVNANKQGHKLSLIDVHDYTDIGFGELMIKRYSAYYEIRVEQMVGGKWWYLAMILDRAGPAMYREVEFGISDSEEVARRASQTWVLEHMAAYKLDYDQAQVDSIKAALATLRAGAVDPANPSPPA